MIYITGDTHGQFERIENFCRRYGTGKDDVMIILGDAGINFSGGLRDQIKNCLLYTSMANGTRTLAFQVSEELFTRIKEHLKKTGQSQKDFVITLIEQALQDSEKNEE